MEDYVLGRNEEHAVDDDVEMPYSEDYEHSDPISNDNGNGRETVDSAKGVNNRPLFATLTDPDVLDCCICFEPLSIPVFQCDNGHIACSTCCTKLRKKCAMCLMPIGFNRCRAFENILQSIKISCPNKNYGCMKMVRFNEKKQHENLCIHVPCHCPLSGCDFVATSEVLSNHFSHKHGDSRIQFSYDHPFLVSLKSDDEATVLQEQTDGKLFILNNSIVSLGNVVGVSCIGPNSSKPGYHYDIFARSQSGSLKVESFTNNVQRGTMATLSPGFLVIPFGYFGSSEPLKLEICIRYKHSATHSAESSRP